MVNSDDFGGNDFGGDEFGDGLGLLLPSDPPRHFEGLAEDEIVDQVVTWFLDNYEDPVHNTPHDSSEGGYQYIWGGPYDAREILWQELEGNLHPDLIERTAETLDDMSMVWTANDRRLAPENEIPNNEIDNRHSDMLRRIEEVEAALANLHRSPLGPPPGIGHNQPPAPIEEQFLDESEITNLEASLEALKSQPPKGKGKIDKAKSAVEDIRKTSMTLGERLGFSPDSFGEKLVNQMEEDAVKWASKALWIALLSALWKLSQTGYQWLAPLL